MIGKKVKVFWPVDESWYTGVVQEYDPTTGEHLLQYIDGDTEWVKIGDMINNSPPSHHTPPNVASADRHPPPEGPPPSAMYDPISPLVSSINHSSDVGEPPKPLSGSDLSAPAIGAAAPNAPPPPYHHPYGSGSYPPPTNPPSSGLPHYMYGPPPPPGYYPPPPHYGPTTGPPHWSYPPPYTASYEGMDKSGGVGPGDISSSGYDYLSSATGGDDDPHARGGAGGRKSGPKPWTKEEDALLLRLVHTMQWPMKWTVVANSLPDRTGKQCRERYVNHLNPRLKNSDWTPLEDATIFHLYNTIGSHWAKMSKIIPGRTDNGIKNRFHNIRRQYEREDTHRLRLSTVEDYQEEIRHDRLRNFPEHLSGKSLKLWDMKCAIGVLAAQSIVNGSSSCNNASSTNRSTSLNSSGHHGNRFGPFREVVASVDDPSKVELCIRCGFIVPSIHTGNEICTKTGWCMSCALISPNVCSNLLRETLNLRRCVDVPVSSNSATAVELRKIIDSFEEFFRPSLPDEAWPYRRRSKEEENGVVSSATTTVTAAENEALGKETANTGITI
jgi:Myb-like DNA-binding domain